MNIQIAATRISEHLAGWHLWDADQALDDARKVMFGAYFEERDGGEIADAMGISDLARRIARELEGLTFENANKVLERVRFVLWRATYAERREASSAFGDAGSASMPPVLN